MDAGMKECSRIQINWSHSECVIPYPILLGDFEIISSPSNYMSTHIYFQA